MNDLVLLIDDAPDVGLLVQKYAQPGGYALRWCERGEEVPALLAECTPQLILIDINLPGMSGLDLCRDLAARTGPRPWLAVFSQWDRPAEVRAALEAGADSIVTKELLRRPAAWQERLQGLLAAQRSGRTFRLSVSIDGLGEASLEREFFPALDKSLHEVPLRQLGAEITDLLVHRAAHEAGVVLPAGALSLPGGPSRWPAELKNSSPSLAWVNAIAKGIWRLLGAGPAQAYLDVFRQSCNQARVRCE